MSTDSPKPDLATKVREWLHTEGYPLEFSTAVAFQRAGFHMEQSAYIRSPDGHKVREIDVLAKVEYDNPRFLVTAAFVVECKWSKSKPWVVFCKSGGITVRECMAQTIANALGTKLVNDRLEARAKAMFSDLFESPPVIGFGARQALSDNRDQVYEALQAVVSKATAYVNRGERGAAARPQAILAFPVIVLEGDLFLASWNEAARGIEVQRGDRARLHWRGAESWDAQATVDVVTAAHLPKFLSTRATAASDLVSDLFYNSPFPKERHEGELS